MLKLHFELQLNIYDCHVVKAFLTYDHVWLYDTNKGINITHFIDSIK